MLQINELKEKKDMYYRELEDLHVYEPSIEWYQVRKYELECEIAFIEETIYLLEQEEKKNSRRSLNMLATVIIVGTILSLLILFL